VRGRGRRRAGRWAVAAAASAALGRGPHSASRPRPLDPAPPPRNRLPHPPPPRPRQDIMLWGEQRGVGMCTDAALYILHGGARLLPRPAGGAAAVAAYTSACGAATARVLLETVYPEFIAPPGAGVTHLFLLNSEHMFAADEAHHARVDAFLCKTRFCEALLRKHVAARGWAAAVRFMGHSSADPLVDLPPDIGRASVRRRVGLGRRRGALSCASGCAAPSPQRAPLHQAPRPGAPLTCHPTSHALTHLRPPPTGRSPACCTSRASPG
jgi:hypothetical protein